MNDAANDTISLMMQFGKSVVPAADHLAAILLDAVQTLLKRGASLGGERAGQLVDALKNRIDGIGEHGQIALKNLVKQGRELMVIPVEREDLQTLKSQLKSYQVDFAIQEDALTGDISVHVKAQDLARIEEALKGIIRSTVNEKQADPTAEKRLAEADIDLGNEAESKQAASATQEEAAIPKGYKADEVEILHGEDSRTFDSVSGTIVLTEHDWDETRPGTFVGDEHGARNSDGTFEPTMKSEKVTASGYVLQAYSDGRAVVLDQSGAPVWSACGIAGNIDASKRLADRGLETYQRKESLQLSPHSSQNSDAKAFDAKLDKAEATAAIEAGKAMSQGLSHERERSAR